MSFTEFEKIFFDAEKAYEEKFGELPSFHGWNRYTSENLQAMEEEEIYESIQEIWPDFPTEEDYLWNEEEY